MFLKYFFTFLLNLICPPTCPICQEPIESPHTLCHKCYNKLNFITNPCCKVCGRPFEYQLIEDSVCGSCLKKLPNFDMARSILEYDDFSKQLVLAFKHGDKVELKILFGKFLSHAPPEILQNIDIIVPVPLHWQRLIKRKYNQSTLLGGQLSKKLGIKMEINVLKRVRKTDSQGKKTHKQRIQNIKNAFAICNSDKIKGKTILIIDDVMTTGATLNECAKILKKNGAKEVRVLSLFRVITH